MTVYEEIIEGLKEINDHQQGKIKLRTATVRVLEDGTIVEIVQNSSEPNKEEMKTGE